MNKPLPAKIAGIGRYLPERVVPNSEVEQMLGLPQGLIATTHAGVMERRWVTDETGSYMNAQAALDALDHAGIALDDIDLILNGSGTQEQAIPDTAPLIQRQLGLENSGVPCISVHTTCLSWLSAFNIASNFIATGQYSNILVTAGDIATAALNPKDPESFVLFGDAAAAAVVTRAEEGEASCLSQFVFRTFGVGAYHTAVMGGGTRLHPQNPETRPEDNLFRMDGREIYLLAMQHAPMTLEMLRPGLARSLGDIKAVIPHQASGLAIKAFGKFGWPKERVVTTIETLGNTIAASIPVTLYKAAREGIIERGDEVLLVGTGAGLSIGAAIITY